MSLFSKKSKVKEAERKALEAKKKEMEKIKRLTEIQLPETKAFGGFRAKEYTDFLKEIEKKPRTKYERACSLAEKFLPIKVDQKTQIKLGDQLRAAYINATPKGVMSLTYLTAIMTFVLAFIVILSGAGAALSIVLLLFSCGVAYYFYNYPKAKARVMSMKMSADTVLAILYMVIYMRTSPNLEGALRFAAQNLKGPLSWDLKKLIWDIEIGVYSSADQAIIEYIYKWKDENKEFAEALHLLRSVTVNAERRNIIFDETISVILNGTRERSKHYAAGMRMPMMIIHAMGVLLPVMGLVLFPIVMIFMGDIVKPVFVFFGYNVMLPAFLYFFTDYTLQTKPPTFSQPDISKAKGVPKMGRFRVGGIDIPVLPVAIAIGFPLILLGFSGISSKVVYSSVMYSILIIIGIAMSIAIYCFLDSYQKIKVRRDIEKIEDEFSVALFQLGNALSGGEPIELAIDKAKVNLKNLKIVEMFEITSMNMKKFGYTFEQALFDKEVGAIWYYPSTLIQSIMQTVIESSKKSIATAASSMIVISNYLKNVHNVKEEIDDILGETISSMKFLAMFLAPMVAGITVTMAVVILQILTSLGETLGGLMASTGDMSVAQGLLFVPWAIGGKPPITPPIFQLIVGIYMIEVAILLSLFLNTIRYGEDAVGKRHTLWSVLIFGIIVYSVSWLISYTMFGNSLQNLLTPVT